ncbi:concanavalin A-like lectin/glucanase domain-containing protein [Plectosphaerella cucumerina]|uniref:Crh-like protein n=1 Tax=Plectosphaerella cucumerina TaxID=40658 RepID=A0A8K0THF0_9PEZI|nr:concanavalin A-like lectin/glucanase domain-containing protein [Plectosphaerella cucumerina]
MRSSLFSLGAALFAATAVIAQDGQADCSLTKKCPESAPCCSQYGKCGVGAYCLGGCDPRMSHSLESCVPAPVCQSRKIKMDNTDRIVDVSKYLGDADAADFMSQGETVVRNGNVLLTMPKNSVGTVLASTTYMWYGSVKARMKSSRGAGVITGFILLSDVKDEIDYEWVGVDLETVQTNYYFQGITDYTQSKNLTLTDTFSTWHEYEIQWTPDKITWLINGQVGRVKERKDTWNATSQQWLFPQTPARVQLSLWPGGLPQNPQGTIDWAGGVIDWDHEDIKKAGYYYASVSDVEIKCWDGKRGEPGSNSGTSYTYDDIRATNDTVIDGDKKTVLASLQGTGEDMEKGKPSSSGSKTESVSPSATDDSGQQMIPGGSNPGGSIPGSDSGSSDNTNTDSGAPNTVPGGGGGGSTTNSDCNARDFTQNEDSCGGSSGDAQGSTDSPGAGSRTTAGASAFAALIAMAAVFLV